MKVIKIREDNRANAAMDIMVHNEDIQDTPSVGCFWYDKDKRELFGVSSVLAKEVSYYHSNTFDKDVKTGGKLHQNIWKKGYFKGTDKRFSGDYTLVPRGIVFEFKDEGFIVFTGEWIDQYPEAKNLIMIEFDLPKDTKFMKDIHWDIGHGWSNELI